MKMRKIFALTLTTAMLMTCAVFPATAATVDTGIYYPDGVSEQTIYYTPNADGTAYELNTEKHPDGVTVYVGDHLVLEGELSKYEGIALENYQVTLSSESNRWYHSTTVDEIYPIEAGTYTVQLYKYTDANGSTVNVYPYDTILTVEVTEREATKAPLNYIDFTTENTKIHGRTDDSDPFTLLWHNSGVEFKFTGTTIGFEATVVRPQQFIYSIDDVDNIINLKGGTFTYILANDLDPNTEHTVKILRNNEIWTSNTTLTSAVTDATSITKAEDREYKIQFIGDSITSGNGLDNYTLDYAYKTAKILGADSQIFSVSGAYMYDFMYNDGTRASNKAGFVAPYMYDGITWKQERGLYTVNDDFTFSYKTDSTNGYASTYAPVGDYDHRFVPDVVVINLGTNDSSFYSNSEATAKISYNERGFVTTYVNFLKHLGELYPSAKIVCSYGMMSFNSNIYSLIEDAVDAYNNIPGHNETVAFKYTIKTDNASPTNSHPGPNSHDYAAKELAAFIQDTFGIAKTTYTADENGNVTLPANPEKDGMIFKGWYDEDGNVFTVGTKIEANATIDLYPEFIDANGTLYGAVDADGNETDDNPVPTTATYENGLYLQGAQVRVQLNETDPEMGLRFISVVNDDLITLLKNADGITNVSFGTLVGSSMVVTDSVITAESAKVSMVAADKIWRNSVTLNSNYDKFTACVIKIPENHFTTSLIVRPYISYTDASGVTRYLYGEQYDSASMFSVAKLAYDLGQESEEVLNYLYENIISKTKGDNDTELEW